MSIASEKIALHKMALRGYRLHDGKVWYIADDDPDQGLDELWVGDWTATAEEAHLALMDHDWPTRDSEVKCPECHDAEVYLGDLCDGCSRRLIVEAFGEARLDVRRGK